MLVRALRAHRSPTLVVLAIVAVLGVVVLTAGAWFGWLGWDSQYQTDPVTGVTSGPYESWQVIGCALTLVSVALAAGVLLHPLVPVAVMPVTFTAVWSVDAARTDDTGLWGVGALMILVGFSLCALLLATVAYALLGGLRRRPVPLA